MKSIWTTCIVMFVAGLTLLASANKALALSGVSDSANFFSADAENKAKSIIEDLARKHHGQQVYVETITAVPDNKTYPDFADERVRAARVNGVHILIIRKGAHVHVSADGDAARLFNNDTRTQLAKQIVSDLRSGTSNVDPALLNALSFVSDVFDRGERQPGGTAAPRSSAPPVVVPRQSGNSTSSGGGFFHGIWGWVCLGVGVWMIFGLIRSFMAHRGGGGGYAGGGPGYGGGGPGYGYGGGYGGGGGFGGGGFGSSLLGGLFGAAAGSWLYDRFSHGGSSYAQPPSDASYGGTAGPTSPDWAGPSDTSQGYESSDAGGGADFGGGDASGGGGGSDFGGGGGSDFGGGGSDFGGGGSDFGGGGSDAGGGGDF